VRELRPHMEKQHLALFCHKLSKGGGNPWTDQRSAQALVAHRGLLAKLGVSGEASVEVELVLLSAPVVSEKIGGYSEQPGSQASSLGFEIMAPSEGDSERLGCQIIGEGRADPTSQIAVDKREVVFEASLEGSTISDQPIAGAGRWRSALHTYLLSPAGAAFRGRTGPQRHEPGAERPLGRQGRATAALSRRLAAEEVS
jgi:hypothetical protein